MSDESETRFAALLSIYGNGPTEEVCRIKPRPLTNARRVYEAVLGETDRHQPITAITPAKGGIRSRQPLGTAIETQKTWIYSLFVIRCYRLIAVYKYSMAESVDRIATASSIR